MSLSLHEDMDGMIDTDKFGMFRFTMDTVGIIGITGNVLGLSLFFATYTWNTTAKTLFAGQSPGIPMVVAMTLLKHLLFIWYGLPNVSRNGSTTLWFTANAISFDCVLLFGHSRMSLFPKEEMMTKFMKICGLSYAVFIIFGTFAWISSSVLDVNGRKLCCGTVATVFSIIMQLTQSKLRMSVVKTESVESMPLFLLLVEFLYGATWFVFGLLVKDPFIAIANGFACGVGAMQLMLFAMCRNKKCKITRSTDYKSEEICQTLLP